MHAKHHCVNVWLHFSVMLFISAVFLEGSWGVNWTNPSFLPVKWHPLQSKAADYRSEGSSCISSFQFCGPLKISLENSVDIWNKKIFLGFGVVSSGTGHEVTVVKMPNLLDFISDHFQTSQARFSSQLSADSVHVTSEEPIRDKQFTLLSIRIRENSMMA